ncbi:hypothetical protein [Zhongshania sp.]|uniref:putative amidoligase domain-containing protein n=1 Tax=Zhongshania sp. TaxID=1971902 RepID=UPI003569C270
MVTIGHDGEFFLVRDGVVIPSQDIIPGTKSMPYQMSKGMLHRDNAMGEFGTPPTSNEDEFVQQIIDAKDEIQKVLDTIGVEMLFKPHHIFEPHQLMHPEVLTFGCEPDFDCYTRTIGKAPDATTVGGLRSAGGHIHFGFKVERSDDLENTILAFEQLVGLYSVIHDDDTKRRELYGQAGRHRPKPYGGEYRVSSNFWYNSEDHMRQMFRRGTAAVNHRRELAENMEVESVRNAVMTAINTSDAPLAQQLVEDLHLEEYVNAA